MGVPPMVFKAASALVFGGMGGLSFHPMVFKAVSALIFPLPYPLPRGPTPAV